jgi:hypothetical protein
MSPSERWAPEKETITEFNARIDREDIEAMTIKCPLESCGAEIGQPCVTDSGIKRIRHARRIWIARRGNGVS